MDYIDKKTFYLCVLLHRISYLLLSGLVKLEKQVMICVAIIRASVVVTEFVICIT